MSRRKIAPALEAVVSVATDGVGEADQARRELRAIRAVIRAVEAVPRLDHDPRCGCVDCHAENQIDRALFKLYALRAPGSRGRRGT